MTLLRDWILMPGLSPLVNNMVVFQFHLLLYKLFLLNVRPSSGRHVNLTRQWIQLVLGTTTLLLWPLYDTSDWSWRLNVLVPCSVAARLVYKGYMIASSDDLEVQLVSRSSSPSELLFGPLYFCAILIWLGLYCFQTERAAIIGAALSIGDALAPWLGHQFGRHSYQVPLASRKTMEGSLCGVFFGTVCGSYLFLYVMGLPLLPLRIVLVYGVLAAVVEGTSLKGMDNIVLAVVLHLSMEKVQEWMPA